MSKSVKYGRKRRSMMKKRKIYPSKKNNARKQRITKKMMTGGEPINILLIIDPQNDFTPAYPGWGGGSLAVEGSIKDYTNMIEMINLSKDGGQNNPIRFSEIHISLDTHTERHIGHCGFWQCSEDNKEWIDAKYVPNIAESDTTTTLKIDDNGNIKGDIIISFVPFATKEKYFRAKYEEYRDYAKNYVKFFYPENKHGLKPMIWNTHCIENTPGHKIYTDLQNALNKHSNVFYHLKGQNELTEMYSIFSAENKDIGNLTNYHGKITKTCDNKNYSKSYETAIQCKNVEVTLNTGLIQYLTARRRTGMIPNLYICGQARTHCVKSSIIDIMEHLKDNSNQARYTLNFIKNMSSPILGFPDEIDRKVREYRGNVFEWENNGLTKK